MKKTNIICAIYRRLGKCSANDKGRCQNLHDARYIMMCKKFLLGSCSDATCSLSHEANLHKMPVCKYFLKGLCLKEKCLYLHKKLSDSTKLCADFVKGYCSKADKVRNIKLVTECSVKSILLYFSVIFCMTIKYQNNVRKAKSIYLLRKQLRKLRRKL